jgi:hypothetical protein
MPVSRSITFWNRLEPRPRSTDLANALAARVRDPAWFLARQWQLGEFQGEDAGSPAYLTIAATTSRMVAWSPSGAADVLPLPAAMPIESAVTAEGASPDDLALAVELGQSFDRFLVASNAQDLRGAFLAAYPIPAANGVEDPRAARLRRLWQGRAINGRALYFASQEPPQSGQPPPGVPHTVPSARQADAADAVELLAAWVASTVGSIDATDPVAWRPQQLDYALRVFAGDFEGGTVALATAPHRDGDVSWHALDVDAATIPASVPPPSLDLIERTVIPGHVRFRGMPNERFWDFEDGRVDFGGLRPDRRNLASLLLTDFMLVHGNDWFLVPLELPVGVLCQSKLTMVDVFGGRTVIDRADATDSRWSMFSIARPDGTPAPYFVLPHSAASVVLDGVPLEDVRFLRDDTANLAWAVERSTEGNLGAAWLAADRIPAAAPDTPTSDSPLVYRIQTNVPSNWIPFQPVKLDGGDEIALERAALLSLDGPPTLPTPLGRVLEPSSIPAGTPYRVREEEVPREGTRVVRRVRRARAVDGETHVWVARARSIGGGEGWSGLRFDLAVPITPPSDET